VNKRQDFVAIPRAWIRRGATALVCSGLFALLSIMVVSTPWSFSTGIAAGNSSIVTIGKHFFTDFLLPFELASVLLLMALIGAIILARRELLPDDSVAELQQPALTLPERPRELIAVGAGAPERTIAQSLSDQNN